MSDYDGDEQWDIFLVSPKTGQVVNLTNTREIAEENPTWSHDGRYLAYIVKPKTSSVFEIDVYDTLMRDVKHLTSGTPKDRMNYSPIWSADGKFIVYTQEQAKGTDSNVFLVDVATAESTLLTPHDGEQTYSANGVSPDGKKRPDHVQCHRWLRQRWPARHRQQKDSLADERQVENFRREFLSRWQVPDLRRERRWQHRCLPLRHCNRKNARASACPRA